MRDVKLGVIGHPISHSKSPAMHTYWFQVHDINAQYLGFDVMPDALEQHIKSMMQNGYMGCNITVPHKQEALKLCDVIDTDARAIGAVNTLLFQDGIIHGYNTDWRGFLHGLWHHRPDFKQKSFDPARPAVILGAGGVARAVLYSFLDCTITPPIVLINRTEDRADDLVKGLDSTHYNIKKQSLGDRLPSNAQLVVNAISDRTVVPDLSSLPADCFLYDLSYNPVVTPFLDSGKAMGLNGINGAAMLACQGVLAFNIWFGVQPVVDDNVLQIIESK